MDATTGQGYRGPAVCKIVGITYRQLDHWTRTSLIEPSVASAQGSGSQRLYSYNDLVELKVVKSLLDGGLSLQRVRKVIEQLRDLGTDLAAANLVIQGNTVTLIGQDDDIFDLMRNGQGVLNLLSMDGVVGDLDDQILTFGGEPEPGRSIDSSEVADAVEVVDMAAHRPTGTL